MKEIGGYLELERFSGKHYHEGAIFLNSGRGCLAYLVELRSIRRIWVPDWMCGSVPALFCREGVEVLTYPIGFDFLPIYDKFKVGRDEWLLLMDYYGQLQAKDVEEALKAAGGQLVVDETQGFFRSPWPGADTVYTCRKWFGVSDGAYVVTADGACLERRLARDESHRRMGFLLGRFERLASEFFVESSANNDLFDGEPAKSMSPITENILRGIDYESAKKQRNENWDALNHAFSDMNCLALRKPDGAFMYPLMTEGAQCVRQKLIENNIFVPCLWPDMADDLPEESVAWSLAEGILPLPIDQRYGREEMKLIVAKVVEHMGTRR